MKLIILLSILFSTLSAFAQAEYNRAECDSLIDVKRYIVAGSLDNKSAGGKTYNFDRIVGALENELLSGEPPDAKRFTCLSMLHKKAHEDATEYWVGRLAKSTCANDDGEIPSVKPADCDDDTWDKFHRSKSLIDRSAKRIAKLTTECVERNGNTSCSAMKSLKDIQQAVEPLAETTNMDKCCDQSEGPAFRVLRGFYTVEFGDMNDSELQKECYKRTRPSNKVEGVGDFLSTCVKSAARGIAEAVMKWFKTAKAIYELGSVTEIWRIVRNMSFAEVAQKIGALVSAMVDQLVAQLSSWNNCFTGPYKVDQACKLASSMAIDFFVGGGIAKGIGFLGSVLKAGVKDIAGIAKNLVASSPKTNAIMQKLKPGAAGKTTSAATSATTRAASKKAASNLAIALRPVTDFSKSVAARVRKLREKEGGVRTNLADRVEPTFGPNATTAVQATEAASSNATAVVSQTSSRVTNVASSGSSSNLVKLTNKSVQKIEKDIRAFRDSNYKAMYATRGTRAVDAPESLFVRPDRLIGKTPAQKMKMIEDAAKARRAQVERLSNTSHPSRLTQAQAREILDNMDDALARLRTRYGQSASTSVASGRAINAGARVGAATVDAVEAATSAASKQIDTAIPTTAATSSTASAQAVVGGSSSTATTAFTNTSTSFIDALPKVDMSSIAASTARVSKAVQKQMDDINEFMQKARANAAQANPSASARSSVYRNQSNRAISQDAIRRHGEIENLYRKGIINDEQAHAMHDIVRVTESSATGTATRYNTRYIAAPNTNPSTFVLRERGAPVSPVGVSGKVMNRTGNMGAPMTAAQTNRYSDSGKETAGYDDDTIAASEVVVGRISASSTSITKEFAGLKTEAEVLDHADELRVKVKTVEATRSATSAEEIEKLQSLLESINKERDRALQRIRANEAATAPVPAQPAKQPASTPVPAGEELLQGD